MGVYINIEMPTSCGYCPLRHEARDGDECYLGASLREYQKRPDDCPLVHIPEHGRLIDADEFLKRAIGTKCFHGDYALMLEELVGESTTIIPADADEERREYDAQVEAAKYCEMYEPTYDPETGAM